MNAAPRAGRVGRVCRARSGLVAFAALAFWSLPGRAQVVERFAIEQHGDFALIGNTLAQDCALESEPEVGEIGSCGASADDTGSDVLWSVGERSAVPVASTLVAPEEAASVAVLALPDGALVTRAELYWSARAGEGDPTQATLGRGEASVNVPADRTSTAVADGGDYYQSNADVTDFVRELGAGPYRLSGIDVADPVGLEDSALYAGWWLVVVYALDSDPIRRLAIYDGFGVVLPEEPIGARLEGFEVPRLGIDAKLGVVGFDGDDSVDGDQLRFGRTAPLGAALALDDSDNFFDGSRRSSNGRAQSVDGDLPQLSGEAGSLSGVDLHVVDVAASLAPGQTSAEVLALTTSDRFFMSGLVFSVTTATPELALSSQSVRDVDGPPLRPGDELEYSVIVNNSGNGAAPQVTLSASLPAQVSYVPGSLAIAAGANAGALTDEADPDVGEIDRSAGQTLIVRLGQGAGPSSGGRLGVGESSVVTYRVRVEPGASGSIVSQALIGLSREAGAEPSVTPTDSDLATPGVSPTSIRIDDCALDADCGVGRCDASVSPRVCVACQVDLDCPGLTPSCDASHACVCVPSAAEFACDGKDDDCDGAIDEGLAGVACEVADGLCAGPGVTVCDGAGGVRCEPDPAATSSSACESARDDGCGDPGPALDPACRSPGDESEAAADAGALGSLSAVVDAPGSSLGPVAEASGAAEASVGDGLGSESVEPSAPGSRATAGFSSAVSLGGGGGTCSLGAHGSDRRWAPWLGAGLALLTYRRRKLKPPQTRA